MIVKTIHRPETAFLFYLEDTLDRFQHHIEFGEFPDDDEYQEQRLELYEMLTEDQRLEVWGLSADLYSLLDKEQTANRETNGTGEEIAERLQNAYGSSDWPELLRVLRLQSGMMERSVVDYMRYRSWSQLGYPEVALAFIKNAIRLDPADSAYKHLALELVKKMKGWNSLAQLANQYALESPTDIGVLLAVGESYHDLAIHCRDRSYDEKAVEYLKRGLEAADKSATRDSQFAFAVVTLAFALLHLGRADEAVSLLDLWIQRDSANSEFHAARGMVHLTVDYESAIQDFKQAVNRRSKNVLPYLEFSNWLLHEGKFDEAIRVAKKGLDYAKRASDQA
ncbi:MAG TPA: hypothetical protein PLR25_28545, partial [Planctomycetaceae bacterium]|nr:hypothetical protein [Planctomycetaceae bacterium]